MMGEGGCAGNRHAGRGIQPRTYSVDAAYFPTSGGACEQAFISRAMWSGSPASRWPALISLLSLSTISAGVFLGAPNPNEPVTCLLGMASRAVAKCECRSRPLRELACELKRRQTPPENCYKEGSRETLGRNHDVHARARGAGPRCVYPGS